MSGKGESFGTCIDTNRDEVVYALMALDTELNQLHRLCIEQGPFFKALFGEMSSDAHRQGLKQKLPRQPENQSHFERAYWKPAISCRQIEAIHHTVDVFGGEWNMFYERHQRETFRPEATWVHTTSPLSLLDDEIITLTSNIKKICQYLTSATDTAATQTSDKVDLQVDEFRRTGYDLYQHVDACMQWIEMTYDDAKEQAEIKKKIANFMHDLCGPFATMFGSFGYVAVQKRNLDLVIEFQSEMQGAIINRTKKDSALRRQGTKLMNELKEIIVKCQGLLAKTPPEKQKIDATLPKLLAQLTQMGNCSP
jgi:hypothetical protein